MRRLFLCITLIGLGAWPVHAQPPVRLRPALPGSPRPTNASPNAGRAPTASPMLPPSTSYSRSMIPDIYDPYGSTRKAAFDIVTLGEAYKHVPPYALGYNPYVRWVNYGPVFPDWPTVGGDPGIPGPVDVPPNGPVETVRGKAGVRGTPSRAAPEAVPLARPPVPRR